MRESGSEVSHFIPEPRNFAEVTEFTDDIKKPCIVSSWAKDFVQDTSVFPLSGSLVGFRNFESLRNFPNGKLQCSGPSAVADSHATE